MRSFQIPGILDELSYLTDTRRDCNVLETVMSSQSIDKPTEDEILAAFRERDIPVTRNDLAHALGDDGFRSWANTHLSVENLLTKDELKL